MCIAIYHLRNCRGFCVFVSRFPWYFFVGHESEGSGHAGLGDKSDWFVNYIGIAH